MSQYEIFYRIFQNHPLFLSCTVVEYHEEIRNKSSFNFGRIYLTMLYKNFTTVNCHGKEVPNPRIQLRPVSNYFTASAGKGSKAIILGINPTRWFAITGQPAHLYNENVLDMYDLLPQTTLDSLYMKCMEIKDPDHIIRMVDGHLEGYYKDWQKPCPLDDAVAEIFINQGMVKLQDLLKRYPFARTTFGSYFKKYIGYSPKFFIRLVHFNNIIREIENSGSKLSQLLRSYDFYDYAHFKKDFQLFTGIKPVDYPAFKESSFLEDILKEIGYDIRK